MNTVASATSNDTTPPHVSDLITEQTRVQIGARRPLYGAASIQYAISRPPFVTDEGQCMVRVSRQDDGTYTVAVGRQGMCADIYTEITVGGVDVANVDAVVLRVCTARTLNEANGLKTNWRAFARALQS